MITYNSNKGPLHAGVVWYATDAKHVHGQLFSVAPTYDPDGNMTSDGTWSYAWDAENRLVGVSPRVLITGSRTYSCEYDHMGRRVKKIEKRHAMAESEWIIHTFDCDAWNLLRERIQSADAMTTNQYTWGLDLSGTLAGAGGIGGLLVATLDGTNLFYTSDANGNITDLLDDEGSPAAYYEYDPYGNITAQSGNCADANPFRFNSEYCRDEANLYYYGRRYYRPEMGRWINRDPVGEFGGINLCLFDMNSQINFVDPFGLDVRLSPWNGEAVNHSSSTTITIQGDWVEHEWSLGALKAVVYPWTTSQDREKKPPTNAPWFYVGRREISGTYNLPPGHSMKNDHSNLNKIVDSDFLVGATWTVYKDKKCCNKATLPVKIGWNTLKVYDCPNGIAGVYYTK